MANSSLSLKFTFFLSLSLAASYTATSTRFSPKHHSSKHSLSTPKATTSDLLSLLGTKQQSSSVNPQVAEELKSCFKFLVPFTPSQLCADSGTSSLRRLLPECNRNQNEENSRVWFPPAPVLELARLAVDSGGNIESIHRTLDPTMIPVPDVEGSKKSRCELTRTPYGRRFINKELNSYLAFLFEIIATHGPNVGLNVSLNRYDFFHGHIFLTKDSGRLGILFHAREYPAYDEEVFPYNMGYCQRGSNVRYDDSMNLRNILWLAPLPSNSTKDWLVPGVLVVLDARPGGIIFRDLIPEYVDAVRTLYEDDFGDVVADVNYLDVGSAAPDYQIFIC